MWPDQFLEGKSRVQRALLHMLTRPMDQLTREACAGATAITGHTDEFVDWGVGKAGRMRRTIDKAFPLGYSSSAPTEEARMLAQRILDDLGVPIDHAVVRFTYVGTITRHVALDVVLDAAQRVAARGAGIQVVLCGTGDRVSELQARAKSLSNVRLLGWQGGDVIWELLRRTQCGLAPYLPSQIFAQSVPNKVIEYFSAGVPVLGSLGGVVRDLLEREAAGWYYGAGDAGELAEKMLQLSKQRGVLKTAATAAARVFAARFRAEEVYGAFAAHVEEIVDAAAGVRGTSEP
jgi:glycosyltransferase involved in cell wall biosynthesis